MSTRRTVLAALLGVFSRDLLAQANALSVAETALREIAGEAVRPFSTRDFGREAFAGARSALVPKDRAERLLYSLRARIPPGIVAFVGVTIDPALNI